MSRGSGRVNSCQCISGVCSMPGSAIDQRMSRLIRGQIDTCSTLSELHLNGGSESMMSPRDTTATCSLLLWSPSLVLLLSHLIVDSQALIVKDQAV